MSKRPFDTSFWTGKYVRSLEPEEKLVYIYLVTNPMGSIAGIFEEQDDLFAFELRLSEQRVKDIIHKLDDDGKIICFDGHLALSKWCKHQVPNPSVVEGILRVLATLSTQRVAELIDRGYTLPTGWNRKNLLLRIEAYKSGKNEEKEPESVHGVDTVGTQGPNNTSPHYTNTNTSPNGSPPKTQGDDLKKSLDAEKGAGKQPFVLTHAERATVGEKWPSVDVEAAYRFVAESAPTVWNSPAYFVKRLETMKADGSLPAKRANYNGFKLNT